MVIGEAAVLRCELKEPGVGQVRSLGTSRSLGARITSSEFGDKHRLLPYIYTAQA